jgi:hypothetical protein
MTRPKEKDYTSQVAYTRALEAYCDSLPQLTQQEPVAVVSGYYGGQCVILPMDPAQIFNSNTALYTSPPAQRKPLTDDEIWREYRFLWPFHPEEERKLAGDILMFARAIEAAHGIKENT